jgi:phosphoglycerate dehydrogenase-like enzyme
VARLGVAFGMRVVAWSPRLTDATANAAGVERRTLDELLQESDVVSIHAALTSESRGLLDARRIDLMKSTAYLINTARGPIVDQDALVAALTEKRIAGAGLDVFDEEPLPAAHPLTKLSNVVLTPHIGWPTDEGYARFSEAACDVLLAHQAGRDVPRFSSD